jgi:hypothetical protein
MTRKKPQNELPPPPARAGIPAAPEVPAQDPTIGEFFGVSDIDPAETPIPVPTLPGFEMSDEPFEGEEDEPQPPVTPYPAQQNSFAPPVAQAEDLGYGMVAMPTPPPTTIANVSYESRITIVEAFRYNGSLRDAPMWVNRNWLSHGDYDPLRKIEPGPALRVPLPGGTVLARIGDYVVIQSVLLSPGLEPEKRLEVWPAETFQKLFVPKPNKPLPSRPGGRITSTPGRLPVVSAAPEA